jgi:ribosomal-protein-alanine N-acetyltransferase
MEKIFIETDRLKLVDYSIALVDEISKIYNDPEVIKFTLQNRTRSDEEIYKIIESEQSLYSRFNYSRGKWLIYEKSSNRLMGYVGLRFVRELERFEITYAIIGKHGGNGYATEAAKTIVNYAFEELKLAEVIGLVEDENLKSSAILKKLGFNYSSTIKLYGYDFNLFRLNRKINTPESIVKLGVTKRTNFS